MLYEVITLLMMVVTCIDVIGAKVFLYPLVGSIDIVKLSQLVAISFAAASALILGNHVQVEFFIVITSYSIHYTKLYDLTTSATTA